MTIGVNAVLRAVAQFAIGNISKAQNVYHFTHESVESKTDEQVVTALSEYVVSLMLNLSLKCAEDFGLEKVECFTLVALNWEPIGVATPVWLGNNVADRTPSGVACMVSAYKERSGYADRKFLAGLTEEGLAGDVWIPALLEAVEDYAADWIAPFTGSESTLLRPVSFRPIDGHTRPYTSWAVSPIASYQRRRKPGVGLT